MGQGITDIYYEYVDTVSVKTEATEMVSATSRKQIQSELAQERNKRSSASSNNVIAEEKDWEE